MELILWRHAEAENGLPDSNRALTAQGEKQAGKISAFLRTQLPQNTRILVSPARRTQQTAQALTRNFITEPSIAPGASPQALLKAAGWPECEGCTLIVGHQPALGELAALLMTGKPQYWRVKKGAVCWLNFSEEDNQAALRLIIAPEHL